ncbi:MAG: efflux RND transporter permease subunit [Lachnospiraceae bacterium]|nr:efflux RND transporter permease subunit [Lachnospiraceae bacterium]MBP3507775.1 efflux RND transporter permease subunit [Lachnospiraceae bacterium]
MPKFSVKKPYTVLVGIIALLVFGFVTFTRLSTDLLPEMELPYVMVITTYPGAAPERVESQVTEVLESSLGTINGVENLVSTSSENYSMVMLEFSEGTNMDSAMVDLSTAIDQLSLPENCGTPMLMEVSMDMMPTMEVTVDCEGMDIYELSAFAEDTIIPYLERQTGVASVEGMGLVDEMVEIRLDGDRIDALNDDLAAYVDDSLADAKKQLDSAGSELSSAQSQLDESKKALEDQQNTTSAQLAQTSQLLDEAVATRAAYSAQVTSLQASRAALQAEQKAYVDAGIEDNYNTLNGMFTNIYNMASSMSSYLGIDMSTLPKDIVEASENPDKLAAMVSLVESMAGMPGSSITTEQVTMLKALTSDNLKQIVTAYNRIPVIENELANLEIEIAAAQAVLDNVNTQTQEAVNNYTTMEEGKISAAAGFGSASAQLAAAQSALDDGKKEMENAVESYESAKETALKNANLDALLSLDTLSKLIYAQNFAMPAGYIYEGDAQYLLKVGDEFSSVDELNNALLCDIDGIGEIRLKDVATVTMIDNSGVNYAKVNGNQAIILAIYKASTAGTASVSDECNEAVEELMEKYPDLNVLNLMDQGEYIDMIIKSVLSNLIFGAILAIIVLALFLKDVKPTIVVAFSIPLSVLFAMVLMYFSGMTMNIISLSGLALGVGMLVDNSIVVIENIYRLRNKGIPSARAAVLGANQVAGAIMASTLTTICVFLPMVFSTGIARQLLPDMAWTIAFSLVASLIVALTVVPSMSATVLRNTKPKTHRWFDGLIRVYEKALRFCLKRKWIPITLAVVLLAGSVFQAFRTGLVLLPSMGSNQMSVSIVTNSENSDEENYALADEAMERLLAVEGVETVGAMTESSMSLMGGSDATDSFYFYIIVSDKAAKNNEAVGKQMEEALADMDLEEVNVSLSNMDMSSLMGSGMQIDIYGSDIDEMMAVSEDVMAILEEVGGMEEISNGQEEGDQQIKIVVDKDKAMKYNLTVAQIFSELASSLTTEDTATTLTVDGKDYEVIVVDETNTVDRSNLMDYEFEVQTTDEDGNQVTEAHTLDEFAKLEDGKGVASINRENQQRYMSVTATTMEGYNTTLLARDVQDKLDDYEAPEGITIEIAGESENVNEALKDMLLMILLAIVLIYLVMMAQFQNPVSPFIVLLTIPLAFTGGFLGLLISGEEISIICLMGFLVLAGVIVNNGIVFVDYVNQLRLGGMEKKEALVETGKTRMRPILMTALTTILAMSTMAFSNDMASAMGKGMAIAVIGGLAYGTLMTLFIVPVFYDIIYRKKEMKKVDIGDEDTLKEDELLLAEGINDIEGDTSDE